MLILQEQTDQRAKHPNNLLFENIGTDCATWTPSLDSGSNTICEHSEQYSRSTQVGAMCFNLVSGTAMKFHSKIWVTCT